MAPRPSKLSTSYPYPWALVRRAGDTLGKRPSTRMAFIVKATAQSGQIVSFTGYVMSNDLTGWTKRCVRIAPADIVKEWRKEPTPAEVQRVKARMPVITTENQRWNWGGREAAIEGRP
jgi:hypothetical protein